MFINLLSWELIMIALRFIIISILKSPITSFSEFVCISSLQITNTRFLLVILSFISFFWARRCTRGLCQQNSGQRIRTLMTLLLLFLVLFFFSSETFILYVIFELSVIPIFVIIIGWGYQSERVEASLNLMFYTVSASLPLLRGFICIYIYSFSKRIIYREFLVSINRSRFTNLLTFCLMAAFLVKLPIYGVHLWLPKAHVEAPVFGSIILAAILLKLGRFGILVFFPFLFLDNVNIFIRIRIIGGVLVRILCIRLVDLKIIIAYSSVSHIGCVLIPVILRRKFSTAGGMMLIIAHAVSSSAMFLISYNLYQINFSRSLLLTKGVLVFSRTISLIWFLILIINMAAPPTLNLLSEILVIARTIYQNKFNVFLLVLLILTGSAYTLIMYSSSIQGTKIISINNKIITLTETLNVFNHLIWGASLIFRVSILNI